MVLKKVSLLFLLITIYGVLEIKSQSSSIGVSTGLVSSKFVSQHPTYGVEGVFRHSFWVSVDYKKRFGKYLQIESSLTYQERIPLEMLPFNMGNQGNSFNATILRNWPTNPQNEIFHEVDYARRFPNFKYVHLDLVPSIQVGNKISYSLGIGPFVGILANQKETLISKEDFDSQFHSLLTDQGVIDTISYTMFDFGILPKLSVGLGMNKKIRLSLQAKYYISLYRLNDTLVRRETFRLDNMRWRAILIGFNLAYTLQK